MGWLKTRRTEFFTVPQPVLIVCEDAKSSVYYLRKKIKSLKLHNADVEVDGNSGSAPMSVVDYAIQRKKENKQEAKKKKQQPYGKIFCVMDVDDHPNLKAAIEKAIANGLTPIVSNECFELWYLLHFIDYSTKSRNRSEINKELTPLLGKEYQKADENIFEKIRGNEAKAIALAKK